MNKSNFISKTSREVSRAHSTHRNPYKRNLRLKDPVGKEQIQGKEELNPYYIIGFIEGEGSFYVGIGRHKTLRRKIDIRPAFTIELRADDREILERILITIGCGKIYDCSYERYGWYPHVKYKIGSTKEMKEFLIPFLDRYPLQAKKAEVYALFREIVLMVRRKEHLTDKGFKRIQYLRNEMRKFGKKHNYKRDFNPSLETARIRENRSSGGVGQKIK
ncbi:LAGLIDADG family homing endonuclease [Patescibacteria group bacterium AH-259-L05]|nr:LAGLIDADG family homing endonuclease [Patescibacteria group bacterium AH-259-L05]